MGHLGALSFGLMVVRWPGGDRYFLHSGLAMACTACRPFYPKLSPKNPTLKNLVLE